MEAGLFFRNPHWSKYLFKLMNTCTWRKGVGRALCVGYPCALLAHQSKLP